MRFASNHEDRFEGVAWEKGQHGLPVIQGALSVLECHPYAQYDGGDHTIFVGKVKAIHNAEEDLAPLSYFAGKVNALRHLNVPPHLHLVFVWVGHAQIAVLDPLACAPSLVCNYTNQRRCSCPYSGMLPGYVEGVWSHDDITHIDLGRLAAFAGAHFIQDEVTAINPENKSGLLCSSSPDIL